MADTEKIFTRIYSRNRWQSAESRSGPGSTAVRTKRLRSQLNKLLRELKVRTLLDVPCGDFNWMRLADLRAIQYTGADIVPELVRKNILRYGSPGRRFIRADITRSPLPKSDLVLCRDGLIHLSFADIERALQTIRESGSTYLLLTSFTDCSRNTDIATGDFRPLNFCHAPFNFPAALRTLADGPMLDGSYPDQVLALYRVSDLPARFEYAARIAALQRTANRLREGMETMLWEARRTYARWRYGLSD
jgi:SAM-dependent methyltransferase